MSELLNKYYDQGLRVLLFPCNQFMAQESGDSCAISATASGYNPKFIMTEKVHVNGSHTHPMFAWMKKQASGFLVNAVKWNFTKFLIDRQGHVYPLRFAPNDEPNKMIPDIEKLLNKQ
jgi:glutathione peroxidase